MFHITHFFPEIFVDLCNELQNFSEFKIRITHGNFDYKNNRLIIFHVMLTSI